MPEQQAPQIDANKVIEKLGMRIQQMALEYAILQTQYDMLGQPPAAGLPNEFQPETSTP